MDIKPANMEELTEVITAAQYHPTSCHMLIYSSSKGTIRLCDMREKALCDDHAKCELAGEGAEWEVNQETHVESSNCIQMHVYIWKYVHVCTCTHTTIQMAIICVMEANFVVCSY